MNLSLVLYAIHCAIHASFGTRKVCQTQIGELVALPHIYIYLGPPCRRGSVSLAHPFKVWDLPPPPPPPPPAIKSWLRQCLNERIVVTNNASAYLIQQIWLMVLSQDLEERRAHAQRRTRYWCSNTSLFFFWCGRKGGIITVFQRTQVISPLCV